MRFGLGVACSAGGRGPQWRSLNRLIHSNRLLILRLLTLHHYGWLKQDDLSESLRRKGFCCDDSTGGRCEDNAVAAASDP